MGPPMSLPDRTLRFATPGAAPRLQLKIADVVVVEGPGKGGRCRVNGRVLRIGSDPGNDLVLPDPGVSRHHATVEDLETGIKYRDENSTNGSWLDGVRVQEVFLASGVKLKLGQSVVRLEIHQEAVGERSWEENQFHGMIGRSAVMRHLFTFLDRIAPSELTVMLLGETGTGKEQVARAIHSASGRADKPFVVFDGASIEPNLVGATLFGHKAGAFTGATSPRQGAFLAADSGTLFIDEVGEIPLEHQPRLLRALERQEVQSLGSDTTTRVDVRVVSATHRNLEEMVTKGTFRQDLFYRLSGVVMEVPPLRNRGEDVALLAQSFLASTKGKRKLGASALRALEAHNWPGNVRELKNLVQRAATLCPDEVIGSEHLMTGTVQFTPGGAVTVDQQKLAAQGGGEPGRVLTLEEREKAAILEVLESTSWNMTLSAELLGTTRQTLRRKLDQYKIEKPGT